MVVPQTDGELLFLINQKGIEIKTELREGISYYRKSGVRHNVINNGKKDLIFIEIEIK